MSEEKKAENFKHGCIKFECSNTYTDTDPDPYYCPSCKQANAAIAKEVDKKFERRQNKNTKSTIQMLEEGAAVAGPHGSTLFSRKVS